MKQRIVSLATFCAVGIIALTLGWFAHAAVPLAAQGLAVDGHATLAGPAAPAAPAGLDARLTYQGRLTNSSGTPINGPVSATFRLYNDANTSIYTAMRIITPTNGLFTVYLGDGADLDLSAQTLSQAVSIGVTVGADAEMTPRQALNTVVGHSANSAGVVGSSNGFIGVRGSSDTSFGVYGSSNTNAGVYGVSPAGGDGVDGVSQSGDAVYGQSEFGNALVGSTSVVTRAAVVAYNFQPAGPAIEIDKGGIKVTGAGTISTTNNTPVFTVKVVTATLGNNVTPSICAGNCVVIDNPLTNGRPDAIVIVTPNLSPAGTFNGLYNDHPVGVWYDFVGGRNKWEIIHTDTAPMLNGAAYNVMVVNP